MRETNWGRNLRGSTPEAGDTALCTSSLARLKFACPLYSELRSVSAKAAIPAAKLNSGPVLVTPS